MAFTLSACTPPDDSAKDQDKKPQTPEEAIGKLSPYHKASFDSWKARVAKACDSSAAFGLGQQENSSMGVDAIALLNSNGGSLVFANEAGGLGILTSYSSMVGEEKTEAEATVELDGKVTNVAAKTVRVGSRCEVYLYDQKVYETYVAAKFQVGQEIRLRPLTNTATIQGSVRIEDVGAIGMSEARGSEVVQALNSSMSVSAEMRDFIGAKLGMSNEEAQSLLQFNFTNPRYAVKIANEKTALWTAMNERSFLASRAALQSIFAGGAKTFPIEIRLGIPSMKFVETTNSVDDTTLSLIAEISIESQAGGQGYRLESLSYKGRKAFDVAESTGCLTDRVRARAKLLLRGGGLVSIQPSLDESLAGCEILNPKVKTAAFETGVMKSLVPIVFAGVAPSKEVDYAGWRQVLDTLAVDAIVQGKNLRNELDPNGNTQIVGILQDNTALLSDELIRAPQMAVVKDEVLAMGRGWAFLGQTTSSGWAFQVVSSLSVAVDPFVGSVKSVLSTLGYNGYGELDALSFASKINADYKAEALRALAVAQELKDTSYELEVFNRVLQDRYSLQDLQMWTQVLNNVKIESQKYPNLAPHAPVLTRLVIGWTKRGEANPSDIAATYQALSNVIDDFPASTQALLQAMGQSFSEGREALAFASGLTPEYKALAAKIVQDSKAAEYESWGVAFYSSVLQKRPSLEQVRAWSDMWTSIVGFVNRELARIGEDSSYMPKSRRKELIERAVTEGWTGLDFQGLEALADIARVKMGCERHVDVSSAANCASSGLFSKKPKMFFDPAFANRYNGLAQMLNPLLPRMVDFEFLTVRRLIVSELFGTWEPIWSKCDNARFNGNQMDLKANLDAYLTEKNSFTRIKYERALREIVKNCE